MGGESIPTQKLVTLCCKIGSGATPRGGSSVYLDSGEISLIRSQNVLNNEFSRSGLVFIESEAAERLSSVVVEEEDVLLNITGDSVARCCQVDPCILPARVNQHVAIIRPKKDLLNPKYLRYFFVSKPMQNYMLSLAGAGATRNALTKGMIEEFDIPLPKIGTQKSIAHILGTLDNKIELNRRMNATLEAMAQALFNSWFVDFDPVIDNALAAGNPIPEPLQARAETRAALGDKRKALPEAIQKQFPSSFVFTEEMGWIPDGWVIKSIDEVSKTIGMGPFGSNIKVETFVDFGVPIINGQHLSETLVLEGKHNYITEAHAEKLHRSLVYPGDLVLTHRGTIGQVSMVPKSGRYKKFIVSQSQMYLRPNTNEVTSCFLIYFFRSHIGQHRLLSNVSQVGVPSIARPSSHLKSINLVLPRIKVLNEFDKLCGAWLQSILNNRTQTEKLRQIRDTLLPKLLSGQLRILDAEKQLENAL